MTNELDFEANSNPPSIRRISPSVISVAPAMGDFECAMGGYPDHVRFQASFFDDDVDQVLWARVRINDTELPDQDFLRAVDPSFDGPEHVAPLICVPIPLLRAQPCNLVRVLVSDDINKLVRPDPNSLLDDPDIDSLDWYVAPSAGATNGGSGQPYISFTDCFPPEGT